MFADISQQLMNQASNKLARSVDPSDQLRNNLQPSVDLDSLDAFHKSFVNFRPVAVIKPQCQQSRVEMKQTQVSKVCSRSYTLLIGNPSLSTRLA